MANGEDEETGITLIFSDVNESTPHHEDVVWLRFRYVRSFLLGGIAVFKPLVLVFSYLLLAGLTFATK